MSCFRDHACRVPDVGPDVWVLSHPAALAACQGLTLSEPCLFAGPVNTTDEKGCVPLWFQVLRIFLRGLVRAQYVWAVHGTRASVCQQSHECMRARNVRGQRPGVLFTQSVFAKQRPNWCHDVHGKQMPTQTWMEWRCLLKTAYKSQLPVAQGKSHCHLNH